MLRAMICYFALLIVLQQRHLEAPYIPEYTPPKTKLQYTSYDDMMLQIDKDEKLEVSERSERALLKTSIRATTKLNYTKLN